MKNKNVRGIIALVVVTALSFGVIAGSRALATDNGEGAASASDVKVLEELDTAGVENIEKAVKTEDGYMVTVKSKGYASDIVMNVSFDEEVKTITKVEVVEQGETEGVGSKVAEADFLSQFEGVAAPVFLPGMSVDMGETEEAEEETAAEETTEEAPEQCMILQDGTYEARAAEEYNGYTDIMTMTVKDGKIAEVVWDCVDADGNLKSVQSVNGEYVMTEDGPTWKEQAEALAKALVENQTLDFFNMNEEGKTDSVSGVSISIYGFIGMVEDCMLQASGQKAPVLNDGTYEAKGTEEHNGYFDQMTMTVKDGKVTDVVWDCVDADGNLKSVQSENGEYVMTEDGPTWKAQAEALAAAFIESQTLDTFAMNEEGKIDTVSGVSISIYGFIDMAQQCLAQAAGEEKAPVAALADGTYEAKGTEEHNGYFDQMTMTVKDGKVTNVVWDCVDADGNLKSVQSENGEYVMTEDGPTWKAQAEALAAAFVESQTLDSFAMNEEGKIDTVSGVSISIYGFIDMAQQCLTQAAVAAGAEVPEADTAETPVEEEAALEHGTFVDAISGATVSSTAAVKGINEAYNFLQSVK